MAYAFFRTPPATRLPWSRACRRVAMMPTPGRVRADSSAAKRCQTRRAGDCQGERSPADRPWLAVLLMGRRNRKTPMITIHHLLVSQSERVIWLMEELGLPYDLKSYPRENSGLAPPIFRELHPLGSAPVIQDGEVTMAESLAIFTYILDLYGDGKLRIA